MKRTPTFHDRREQPPISHDGDVFLVGLGVIAVIAAVFILGAFVFGCSHQQAKTAADQEKCLAAADAWLHAQILTRCNTPSYEACPQHDALEAEWTRRAKQCR